MAREKATRRCNDAPKVSTSSSRTPTFYHENDWERAMRLLPLAFGAFFAAMLVIQIAMGW